MSERAKEIWESEAGQQLGAGQQHGGGLNLAAWYIHKQAEAGVSMTF